MIMLDKKDLIHIKNKLNFTEDALQRGVINAITYDGVIDALELKYNICIADYFIFLNGGWLIK